MHVFIIKLNSCNCNKSSIFLILSIQVVMYVNCSYIKLKSA